MGNKRKSSNSQPTTAGPTEAPSSIAKKRKSMPNVVKDLQKSLRNTDSSDSGPAAITGYNDLKSDQDTMKFLRAQPQLDANFMSTLLNFGIKEMGNREARSENRLPWEALDSNTVVKCILSSFIQINDETARWADYPLSGSKENPLNVALKETFLTLKLEPAPNDPKLWAKMLNQWTSPLKAKKSSLFKDVLLFFIAKIYKYKTDPGAEDLAPEDKEKLGELITNGYQSLMEQLHGKLPALVWPLVVPPSLSNEDASRALHFSEEPDDDVASLALKHLRRCKEDAMSTKTVAGKKEVAQQHIASCQQMQELHEKKASGFKEGVRIIQLWVQKMEEEEARDKEYEEMMTQLDASEDLDRMKTRQLFYVQAVNKILATYKLEEVTEMMKGRKPIPFSDFEIDFVVPDDEDEVK